MRLIFSVIGICLWGLGQALAGGFAGGALDDFASTIQLPERLTQQPYVNPDRVHFRLSDADHERLGGTRDRAATVIRRFKDGCLTIQPEGDKAELTIAAETATPEVAYLGAFWKGVEVAFNHEGKRYSGTIEGVFKNGMVKIRFLYPAGSFSAQPHEIWREAEQLLKRAKCVQNLCVGTRVRFSSGWSIAPRQIEGVVKDLQFSPLRAAEDPVALIEYWDENQKRGQIWRRISELTVREAPVDPCRGKPNGLRLCP